MMKLIDFIKGKDYRNMNWQELTKEAQKNKLDPRLTTFKGEEGAGERDTQKIIEQLSAKDNGIYARWGIIIAVLALIVSIISLLKP
jgi:hypothetical protein